MNDLYDCCYAELKAKHSSIAPMIHEYKAGDGIWRRSRPYIIKDQADLERIRQIFKEKPNEYRFVCFADEEATKE